MLGNNDSIISLYVKMIKISSVYYDGKYNIVFLQYVCVQKLS